MKLGDAKKMNISVISTGADLALGVGGLPRGRICEILDPESSGKTTFCLSVISEAQRQGGNAVFIDVKHALDPRYAKVVGVDLDCLMVAQPESGEDALKITETLIRSGAIDVIVVDSVAALVSKAELDGQISLVTSTYDEPSHAQANFRNKQVKMCMYFHQSDKRKNRCDIREMKIHWWLCSKIFCIHQNGYKANHSNKGKFRSSHWKSYTRKNSKK